MIPDFNSAGYLDPFLGEATDTANRSPHQGTLLEVVQKFSFRPRRVDILKGLIRYRSEMRVLGVEGVQWLSGSFFERIDHLSTPLKPRPGDIDVVSFLIEPPGWDPSNNARVQELSDPDYTKLNFMVDGYSHRIRAEQRFIRWVTYWFGLFSHTRENTWKGMVSIDLTQYDDDQPALDYLNGITP